MDFKPLVLIIDDEAKHRYTLSVILKRAGYGVVGVENAGEALRQLKLRRFQLVFLDIGMPEFDGLHLMAEIARRYAGMPIVILTGDDSVDTTLRAMRSGACAYLLKPINPWQILYCLEQLLPGEARPAPSLELARTPRVLP